MDKNELKQALDLIDSDDRLKKDIIYFVAFSKINKCANIVEGLNDTFKYVFDFELDDSFLSAVVKRYREITSIVVRHLDKPINVKGVIYHLEELILDNNQAEQIECLMNSYKMAVNIYNDLEGNKNPKSDDNFRGVSDLLVRISNASKEQGII